MLIFIIILGLKMRKICDGRGGLRIGDKLRWRSFEVKK